VLSPGPGKPKDAGICEEIVLKLGDKIPILGVCLGHQAICEAYGGTVSYAKKIMHGKQSEMRFDGKSVIFRNVGESENEKIDVIEIENNTMLVARYHSLAAIKTTLDGTDLEVIAETLDGEVMAVAHKIYSVYGLQFHPESILTPQGARLVRNFLGVKKK
jgi:anthranilate synthase component 2